jgi:hypothetical protein
MKGRFFFTGALCSIILMLSYAGCGGFKIIEAGAYLRKAGKVFFGHIVIYRGYRSKCLFIPWLLLLCVDRYYGH